MIKWILVFPIVILIHIPIYIIGIFSKGFRQRYITIETKAIQEYFKNESSISPNDKYIA